MPTIFLGCYYEARFIGKRASATVAKLRSSTVDDGEPQPLLFGFRGPGYRFCGADGPDPGGNRPPDVCRIRIPFVSKVICAFLSAPLSDLAAPRHKVPRSLLNVGIP